MNAAKHEDAANTRISNAIIVFFMAFSFFGLLKKH